MDDFALQTQMLRTSEVMLVMLSPESVSAGDKVIS
jgi:hypothetical protein